MAIGIDHLTPEELLAFNQRIVERLRFLEAMQTRQDTLAFHPGARLSFDTPQDGRLLSTLVKFDHETVTVMTDNGQRWTAIVRIL